MSLSIYSPNAGDGECFIAIHKNDAGDTQSIMIDCGSFSDYVRDIVVNQLNKHIDCLVISHFDDDHTLGIITMLIVIPDLSINKILFNYAPIIMVFLYKNNAILCRHFPLQLKILHIKLNTY